MRNIICSLFQSLYCVIQAPGEPEEYQTGFAHCGCVFPYFYYALYEPMYRPLRGSYELLLGLQPTRSSPLTGPTTATSRSARRSMSFASTS